MTTTDPTYLCDRHQLVQAVLLALPAHGAKGFSAIRAVANKLALLGDKVLRLQGDPSSFRQGYAGEWAPMRGIHRVPDLNRALVALWQEVNVAAPTYHPAELPTLGDAAAARVKAGYGTTQPVMFSFLGAVWTDGAVMALPRTPAAVKLLTRRQSKLANDTVRANLQTASAHVVSWLSQQVAGSSAPDLWIGRDWVDGPARVMVVNHGITACYQADTVAILRGIGARHWALAANADLPHRNPVNLQHAKTLPPVLLGFDAEGNCLGLVMPVSGIGATELNRWQAFGAKPVTSKLAVAS